MERFFVTAQNHEIAELESLALFLEELGMVRRRSARGLTREEMARRMLARWSDPRVQAALNLSNRYVNREELQELAEHPEVATDMLAEGLAAPRVLWMLREAGHEERAPALMAEMAPENARYYRGLLNAARAAFHRYVLFPAEERELERVRRQRGRLVRSLQARQVRFRTLQVDLHALRSGRKAWRARAHRAEREADAHLAAAAAELEQLRREEAAAEAAHRDHIAALAREYEAQLDACRNTASWWNRQGRGWWRAVPGWSWWPAGRPGSRPGWESRGPWWSGRRHRPWPPFRAPSGRRLSDSAA